MQSLSFSQMKSRAAHRTTRRPSAWLVIGIVAGSSLIALPLAAAAAPDDESGDNGAGVEAPSNPTTTVQPATTTTVPPETTTTTTSTTTTIAPTTTTTPDDSATTTTLVPPPTVETVPTTSTTVAPTTTLPGPAAPPERNITVYPEQIEHILATIRYLESRGIYTLPPNKGNASGAYQFIGSTWNNYAGYPHAYLAPPSIQDERAAADVNMFLAQWNNDVSMIPVMWYLPAASRNPALMDVVPLPQHGNVLTIREYQTRWLGVFSFISGQPVAPRTDAVVDLSSIAGIAPQLEIGAENATAMSFPVLGPSRVAVPECDNAQAVETVEGATSGPSREDIEAAGLCTEQAPGIVFGVKLQPVLAVADGVVTAVHDDPGSGDPITVTVTDEFGTSVIYAGFNDDNPGTADGQAPAHLRLSALANVGTVVRAGQVLGFMGDTDPLPLGVRADVPTDATVQIDPDAVAPHIRITMIDLYGNPIDAFGPMIDALFRQNCHVMTGPWAAPVNGSGHTPVTIETTDNDDEIDSEWVITETGQVHATGWAALVNPGDGCGYAPNQAFGPGAAGAAGGDPRWLTPIELPTSVWVALALRDDTGSAGLLRR